MARIDLEKYKAAWKKEQTFERQLLSEQEITSFLRSASKSVMALFKRSLILDLILKGILLVLLIGLAFLMPYSESWILFSLLFAAFHIGGLAWQMRTLNRIPDRDQGTKSALGLLRQHVDFYHRKYYPAMFVGALTSVFLFLIGSLYYLFFKYGNIPPFRLDDILVFGVGSILSFTISAVAQVKQGNFRVGQLEDCLREIEEQKLSADSLEKHQGEKIRNYVLIGLALILGLLLLLYFIYEQTK